MYYIVKDEFEGRCRIHVGRKKSLSNVLADKLMDYFRHLPQVKKVKIYERTGDMVLEYSCTSKQMHDLLKRTSMADIEAASEISENSLRSINQEYQERLMERIMLRLATRFLLPAPARTVLTAAQSVHYFGKAISTLRQKKVETSLLDAATLITSFIRSDYEGAGSVVFLLNMGEIFEDWLEKKKVEMLSETMSLNIDYVWLCLEDRLVQVPAKSIQSGDLIVVSQGEMVPFDGVVMEGAGSVIQTSLTGNALPRVVTKGSEIYAGTSLEEGLVVISVTSEQWQSRYDTIVTLVENSQNLKPEFEANAIRRADRLVPYMLGGGGLTYLLTRNPDRASSFVMADFSYALKLTLPMCVLAARDRCSERNMVVKGGKFMENMADADILIFDKTGTLTKAQPELKTIETFGKYTEDQILRMAACLEEHISNSVSKAVVRAATERGLIHEEMHTDVEHVLAHGIATTIDGKRTLIGSYHYLFEDMGIEIPAGLLDKLNDDYHVKDQHLFLAIEGKLEGLLCVEDTLRDEVPSVIENLKECGFEQIIMLSGDTELSAREAAEAAGIDSYYGNQTPESKAIFIRALQEEDHKVIMVGDGINDSLALTVADVGIAVNAGASISKELADVIVEGEDLHALVDLRNISRNLIEEMQTKANSITYTNGALVALGALGLLTPSSVTFASHAFALATALQHKK